MINPDESLVSIFIHSFARAKIICKSVDSNRYLIHLEMKKGAYVLFVHTVDYFR